MAKVDRGRGRDKTNPFSNFMDRILVSVSGIGWVLLGLALVAIPLGWDPALRLTTWVETLGAEMRGLAIVLGVFLLVVGGRLWVRALPSEREQPNVVQDGELGQLSVSVRAIETLVNRTVRQIEGLQDVGIVVNREAEGLSIHIRLSISSDESMPGVAQQVQERVREAVQASVGVDVRRVDVSVRNVIGMTKQPKPDKSEQQEQG